MKTLRNMNVTVTKEEIERYKGFGTDIPRVKSMTADHPVEKDLAISCDNLHRLSFFENKVPSFDISTVIKQVLDEDEISIRINFIGQIYRFNETSLTREEILHFIETVRKIQLANGVELDRYGNPVTRKNRK